MYNHFTGFGRLTADPEFKPVGDTSVANFTLATDPGYGERKATLFTKCAAWGKQAELIRDSFKKGNRILITGEMQPKNWEKDGKRSTMYRSMSVTSILLILKIRVAVQVSKTYRSNLTIRLGSLILNFGDAVSSVRYTKPITVAQPIFLSWKK